MSVAASSRASERIDWLSKSAAAEAMFEGDEEYDDFDALQVKPSTLEVDYDKNLTELYQAITDQNWDMAASICGSDPIQSAIWVVRHYQDDDNTNNNTIDNENATASPEDDGEEAEIMWRFLPLHSACARQPPASTIAALLRAYPDAVKCVDDQGMYALHYACGNQASAAVITQLLASFSRAAAICDPRGMLPLHYAACWGPSSVEVIESLLVANPKAASTRDNDGNTPLDLAMDGEYEEKTAVAEALRKWIRANNKSSHVSSSSGSSRALKPQKQHQSVIGRSSSHGSEYNDAIVVETVSVDSKKSVAQSVASRNEKIRSSSSKSSKGSKDRSTVPLTTPSTAVTPRLSNNSTPPPVVVESREVVQTNSRATPPPTTARNNQESRAQSASSPQMEISPTRSIETIPSLSTMGMSPVKFSNLLASELSVTRSAARSLGSTRRLLEKEEVTNERSIVDCNLVEDVEAHMIEVKEKELQAALEKLAGVQKELDERTKELEEKSQELITIKALLVTRESECIGLRGSLGDVMEQHDEMKRKSSNTSDRLGTLSISLDSMKEQQNVLIQTMRERNESYKAKFTKRQEVFQQLLSMDKEIEEEEGKLDSSLRKQTREMDAISAVIKAALD